MRILGVDYGEKRIGLAISDGLNIIARGLKFVSKENFFKETKDIIEALQVSDIVVGLPLKMDGSIGEKGKEVLAFVEEIKKNLSLPVVLLDERFTTKIAENILIKANTSRRKRKKVIDKMAAAIILQDYLNRESLK